MIYYYYRDELTAGGEGPTIELYGGDEKNITVYHNAFICVCVWCFNYFVHYIVFNLQSVDSYNI